MENQQPISFRLENGLRVHYYRRAGEALGLGLGLPVGAWQDPVGQEGLAHTLEHFVFCGSTEWSEDERYREMELHGAHFNGITGYDHTFYWLALPCTEMEFGLKYLKKLVFEPTFPVKLLERERGRIHQEAGLKEDPKFIAWLDNKLMDWGFNLNFSITASKISRYLFAQETGSDHPVIGFASTRNQITVDDLREFYKRYYVSNHAALLVLGDVNVEALKDLIAKIFNPVRGAQRTPETRSPRPKPRLGAKTRVLYSHTQTDTRYIAVGHTFSPPPASEIATLYATRNLIIEELLQRFNRESKFSNNLNHRLNIYRQVCSFELTLHVSKEHARLAETELFGLLEDLRTGKFGHQRFELERQAAGNWWHMYSHETGPCLEYLSGLPYIYTDTPPPLPHWVMRTVELDDVRRMAARMLNLNRRIVILHRPILPVVFYISLAGLAIVALICRFFM